MPSKQIEIKNNDDGTADVVITLKGLRPVLTADKSKYYLFDFEGRTGMSAACDGVSRPVKGVVKMMCHVPKSERVRLKPHWMRKLPA